LKRVHGEEDDQQTTRIEIAQEGAEKTCSLAGAVEKNSNAEEKNHLLSVVGEGIPRGGKNTGYE